MNRALRHAILIVLVVAALVVLLAATLVLLSSGEGVNSISSMAYGWAVPLASVFVLIGVIWLLLSQTPGSPRSGERARYVRCIGCGHEVLEDWRLCPYCGTVLEDTVSTAQGPSPG